MSADWISAIAASGTLVVTAGALVFARETIRSGRRNTEDQIADTIARERRQRVEHYLERLNRVEFLPLLAETFDLLSAPLGEREAALARWRAGGTLAGLRVGAVLNFFEEVAGQFNAGALDTMAAQRELVPTAARYWELAEWFVARQRAHQPSAFSEWERMASQIQLERFLAP